MKQKYIRSYPFTTTWKHRLNQEEKRKQFRGTLLVVVTIIVFIGLAHLVLLSTGN